MKRMSILLATMILCAVPPGRAQDAAIQERLDKLSGRVDDLAEQFETQRKHIEELNRKFESLRDQVNNNKPVLNFATPDDLKRLADATDHALKELDQRRLKDIHDMRESFQELANLISKINTRPPEVRRPTPPPPENTDDSTGRKPDKDSGDNDKGTKEEKVIPHVIKEGETLSAIIAACREKGVKVTQEQILKANPGLKPNVLIPGKKILIPLPAK